MLAIKDIAFVKYQSTDLEVMEQFLTDFGMVRSARTEGALYMRGYGPIHHIHVTEQGTSNRPLGFGVFAQRESDLSKLAEQTGLTVEDIDAPGGGRRVQLIDPSGFIVDVVHGQKTLAPLKHREPLEHNFAINRRRVNRNIRLGAAPSTVMRLGHVVLVVPDFRKSFQFYHDVLGMRPSDSYFAGSKENTVAAFMHCGLGSHYTDHHTIALVAAQDGVARFDHSAFEVLDWDDVMQGNAHLQSKQYVHSWGVGRHIQGSQVFDYWRDPFGNKIEHWTDGDLVNEDSPVGVAELSGDELKQWAPPLNPEFFS
jgi:catechol 2,3-dioxygenase-like lactoylglutathione lyase family enzyme